MKFGIVSLLVLTVCLVSIKAGCPGKFRRFLDFSRQKDFEFTADGKAKKAEKALKGSGKVLKGARGKDVFLQAEYVFDQADITDNRGFEGKVCFQLKGASLIDIQHVGIKSIECYPQFNFKLLIDEEVCQGKGGGLMKDRREIKERRRSSFRKYCIDADWNSRIDLGLVATEGQRIEIQDFYIRGCEINPSDDN